MERAPILPRGLALSVSTRRHGDDTLPEGIAIAVTAIAVTAAADVAEDVTALGTIKLACTYDVC